MNVIQVPDMNVSITAESRYINDQNLHSALDHIAYYQILNFLFMYYCYDDFISREQIW